MKPGVPFVAFSLHPDDDDLHVTTLTGNRVKKNDMRESTLGDLELLNMRGLDEAAKMLGMYFLGMMQIEYPEKFNKYPKLIFEIPPGPSKERLDQIEQNLRFTGSEGGTDI